LRRTIGIGFLAALVPLQGCGEGSRKPVDEAAAFSSLLGEFAEQAQRADQLFEKLLPDESRGESGRIEKIVVERQPASLLPDHSELADESRWSLFHKRLPALRRDTFDDFWRRNRDPTVPEIDRAGQVDVVFDAVLPNWQLFWMDHRNAMLVCLSAMGFSGDGRQGLVYVVFPGCLGAYYLLGLDGERWRITAEWEVWVS